MNKNESLKIKLELNKRHFKNDNIKIKLDRFTYI